MKDNVHPFSWQQPIIDQIEHAINKYHICVNTSDTGTGKTYMTCFAAKQLNRKLVVICPKAVIPSWQEAITATQAEAVVVTNYENIIAKAPLKRELKDKKENTLPLAYWEVKRKVWRWLLPKGSLLVFDEAHKLNGQTSQTSKLLVAATDQVIPRLLLSATLCDSPLKMKAIGHALGFHDNSYYSFCNFLKQNNCKPGNFGGWQFHGGIEDMRQLTTKIGERMVRISHQQLGNKFPNNSVHTISVPTSRNLDDDYEKALLKMQTTAETEAIASLRARQLSEREKIPALMQMTKDHLIQGNSVVIFVNFIETVNKIKNFYKNISIIQGGQSATERQKNIRRFQINETKVCVVLIQAGGSGIDLHDEYGKPRVSLIFPTHTAIDFKQALGRIHRAGSLSPAIQYVIFAAESKVETRLRKNLTKKLDNISALNDQDLSIQNIL